MGADPNLVSKQVLPVNIAAKQGNKDALDLLLHQTAVISAIATPSKLGERHHPNPNAKSLTPSPQPQVPNPKSLIGPNWP